MCTTVVPESVILAYYGDLSFDHKISSDRNVDKTSLRNSHITTWRWLVISRGWSWKIPRLDGYKTHREQHLSDLVPVRFPFLCFARHGTAEWLPGRPLGNSKSCNLVLCDHQKPLQKAAANVVFCVNLCFCLCCCWRWGLARGNEQLET